MLGSPLVFPNRNLNKNNMNNKYLFLKMLEVFIVNTVIELEHQGIYENNLFMKTKFSCLKEILIFKI